eukprot:scaffold34628_cov166-Amphora_coffeaeformis.AAC.9
MEVQAPPPTTAGAPLLNKPSSSGTTGNQKNPFYGGGRENFPSLDRALGALIDNEHKSSDHSSSSDSRTDSLDLSIDARAALHEHLRHVNKFGVDGEVAEQRETSTGDVSSSRLASTALPNNTLDEEWENILQGNPMDFHYSLNDSALPTFDRLQVLNATTPENDIEVAVMEMTCIEADGEDDYFNSSKVWQLMTPEKNRGRNPQAVTNRNEQDSYHDDEEDNTPESACMVKTTRTPHPDFIKQDRVSPLSSSNESSEPSPRPSPTASQSPLEALSPLAAAAAAIAQNLERNPSRVASVALADFLTDDTGLHNSLLMTSVHEDLPLITSPFAPAPDMEGSFADWSVQSAENPSFVLPSAMTPIRPLPPLSPIPSVRGSPSSSRRGSGSGSHPSRGSPRSSTSSSSFGKGSWRLSIQASSPQRADLDFGLREEMISPIRPLKLAPTHEEEETSEQESSSGNGATRLSPFAQQAAQTAELFLQGRRKSPLQPPNKWPSLGPADSFESSSTAGIADLKFQQNILRSTTTKTVSHHDPHKDAMTAPLASLDTMSSTDHSGLRSTRSADHALIDRRRFRTVVPRRIVFPDDFTDHDHHGDSFDRPCHSF